MRTGRVFWGVFFLVAGVLLTLGRLTDLHLHLGLSWKYWPLLLIAWGIGLALGGRVARYGAAVVGGILLALFALSALGEFEEGPDEGDVVMSADQVFHEGYDPGIRQATFTLESAAGTFILRDTTSELLTAETVARNGNYRMDRSGADSLRDLSLRYSGPRRGWIMGRNRNSVRVRLHPDPQWDLRFDVGATRLDVDASPFAVRSMEINAGAADVSVKVGNRAEQTRVNVKTGASSVRIMVPESSGCELQVSAPLSTKDFRGFERTGKGLYQTDNFSSAEKLVSLTIHAGVSSLKVVRY